MTLKKLSAKKIYEQIKENKWIILILILLIIERLYAMYRLGFTYSLNSDDASYIASGIRFAQSGMITMHNTAYPSAQSMPGMSVFIGIISFIFGEGKVFWVVLKLIWTLLGSFTALFVYKSIKIFAPTWCAILPCLVFFNANFVWMDNLILTETPYIFLFTATVYFTLKLGQTSNKKYFWFSTLTYMLALMIRANMIIYPLFAIIYLLIKKYNIKLLLKQTCILVGVLLCFIIPWSIRNYIHYDAFIPLTYGTGDPILLGTYQGHDYPTDEELDYKTNVDDVVKQKYGKFFNEDGTYKNEM